LIQLKITYENTTIDLQANGYRVIDPFVPVIAEDLNKPVEERVTVSIRAATESERENMLRAITRSFVYAETHKTGPKGAYVKFAISETVQLYRARLLGGSSMFEPGLTQYWRDGRIVVTLSLKREPVWESDTLQSITLANANASGSSGTPFYNCNDGSGSAPNKRVNYGDIAAASIDGDQPAPAWLSFKNDSTDVWTVYKIFAGLNYSGYDGTAPAPHWFEAEDGNYPSEVTDSTASGGEYGQRTLSENGSSGPNENELIAYWGLTAAQIKRMAGSYYHVIARFTDTATMQQVKYKFGVVMGDVASKGPLIRVTNDQSIQDLGAVQIPPAFIDPAQSYTASNVYLYGTRYDLAAVTVKFDWLMLMPADNFRVYQTLSGGATDGLAYGHTLIDDPQTGQVYVQASGAYRHPWLALGPPLMLHPGRNHRLLLCWFGADSKPARRAVVTLKYRPKKLAL